MSDTATIRKRRYDRAEFARRGEAIYEQQIRPQVEQNHPGQIVAIDIESGAFAVADDTVDASHALLTKYPDAQIWFVRIGYRGVHRFGSQLRTNRAC